MNRNKIEKLYQQELNKVVPNKIRLLKLELLLQGGIVGL